MRHLMVEELFGKAWCVQKFIFAEQRKQRDFDCLAQGFRITLDHGNISPLMHRWGDSGAAAVLHGVQVVHLVAVDEHLVKH